MKVKRINVYINILKLETVLVFIDIKVNRVDLFLIKANLF